MKKILSVSIALLLCFLLIPLAGCDSDGDGTEIVSGTYPPLPPQSEYVAPEGEVTPESLIAFAEEENQEFAIFNNEDQTTIVEPRGTALVYIYKFGGEAMLREEDEKDIHEAQIEMDRKAGGLNSAASKARRKEKVPECTAVVVELFRSNGELAYSKVI